MIKMICQKCSWIGVFGDEPCLCGLNYLDFDDSWEDLPNNVMVIDEIMEAAIIPRYATAWKLK